MALHNIVINWFKTHQRDLPWRRQECTPWGILVSEIMLQQTPVVRVLPRWQAWMERWPTVEDCAAAPKSEILKMWDRLGYPRRALRLHAAAQKITELGYFPSSYDELIELPGIGDYTASAVSCFAFKNREAVIDTNIRRVEARAISGKALPAPSLNAAEKKLAASLVPGDRATSVAWNSAVMELGALICTAKSPQCQQCPLVKKCQWIALGQPPAEYTPKGQSWHGTDRQVRGAIMAVLREASSAVPEEIVAGVEVNVYFPDLNKPLKKLSALDAPQEQRIKAVETLVHDGLAYRNSEGLSLPH